MARIGLSEAARLVGRSRQTLWRDAKGGKLSVHRDERGLVRVDVAELQRRYPTPTSTTTPTSNSITEVALLDQLQRRIADLEARAERAETRAEKAEDAVKEWQERYVKLTERALLTDQRPTSTPETARTPRPTRPRPEPSPKPESASTTAADVVNLGLRWWRGR